MSRLTVFRQARADGGMRTGLDIDGETLVERFEEGRGKHDPRLVWFVDVRFKGARVPGNAAAAITWLKEHTDRVTAGLHELAETLTVGVDPDYIPAEWALKGFPKGVDAKVNYSSVHRIDARAMAKVIDATARLWASILDSLQPEHAA